MQGKHGHQIQTLAATNDTIAFGRPYRDGIAMALTRR